MCVIYRRISDWVIGIIDTLHIQINLQLITALSLLHNLQVTVTHISVLSLHQS
jgi:hypothetical protein